MAYTGLYGTDLTPEELEAGFLDISQAAGTPTHAIPEFEKKFYASRDFGAMPSMYELYLSGRPSTTPEAIQAITQDPAYTADAGGGGGGGGGAQIPGAMDSLVAPDTTVRDQQIDEGIRAAEADTGDMMLDTGIDTGVDYTGVAPGSPSILNPPQSDLELMARQDSRLDVPIAEDIGQPGRTTDISQQAYDYFNPTTGGSPSILNPYVEPDPAGSLDYPDITPVSRQVAEPTVAGPMDYLQPDYQSPLDIDAARTDLDFPNITTVSRQVAGPTVAGPFDYLQPDYISPSDRLALDTRLEDIGMTPGSRQQPEYSVTRPAGIDTPMLNPAEEISQVAPYTDRIMDPNLMDIQQQNFETLPTEEKISIVQNAYNRAKEMGGDILGNLQQNLFTTGEFSASQLGSLMNFIRDPNLLGGASFLGIPGAILAGIGATLGGLRTGPGGDITTPTDIMGETLGVTEDGKFAGDPTENPFAGKNVESFLGSPESLIEGAKDRVETRKETIEERGVQSISPTTGAITNPDGVPQDFVNDTINMENIIEDVEQELAFKAGDIQPTGDARAAEETYAAPSYPSYSPPSYSPHGEQGGFGGFGGDPTGGSPFARGGRVKYGLGSLRKKRY